MNARLNGKLARLPRPTLDSVLRRAHLSVSLIAVLAAGLTLTAVALLALRVYSDQNLRLVARSMSYTVEAAVVFGDPMAAKEALALIGVNEDIDQAQVSDRDGKVLARWERGEHGTRNSNERSRRTRCAVSARWRRGAVISVSMRRDRRTATIRLSARQASRQDRPLSRKGSRLRLCGTSLRLPMASPSRVTGTVSESGSIQPVSARSM